MFIPMWRKQFQSNTLNQFSCICSNCYTCGQINHSPIKISSWNLNYRATLHPESQMYVICAHLFSRINQCNGTQIVSIGKVKSLLNICGFCFLWSESFLLWFFSKNALILSGFCCIFQDWVNLEQGQFWFKINFNVRALEKHVETVSL